MTKEAKDISELPPEVIDTWVRANNHLKEIRDKGIYISLPNTINNFKGKSFLPVGSQIMVVEKPHETFHQLILANLRNLFEKEWWENEIKKPDTGKHYIVKCFEYLEKLELRDENQLVQIDENTRSFIPDGYVTSLVNIAFDVWVLQHKNSLPDDLVERLKKYKEYQSVRYEIAVASIFCRIGCTLDYYDDHLENDTKHGEFIATFEATGEKVVVEAKSRHRNGVIHTEGNLNVFKASKGDITQLLNKALLKDRSGLPYVIFIEVNSPSYTNETLTESKWFRDFAKIIQNRSSKEAKEPYNLLTVTNFSPHYEGKKVVKVGGAAFDRPPSDLVEVSLESRQEGEFLHRIMQATCGYGYVPVSFGVDHLGAK